MEKNVKSALDNASRWCSTAQEAYVAKNYDNSVYAMERARERGLKAVLISRGVEYPKIHDITGVIRASLNADINKKRINQDMIDDMLSTLQVLLKYRNAAGYMFANNVSMDVLKRVADDNLEKVEKYLTFLNKILV